MPQHSSVPRQSGFTLVEIAIVLVIIGLLLGGVLKGQELINSAKVKNLAQDFRVVPTFIYAYQDKFRALPGDDSRATTHLCPTTNLGCTTNGDAVGVIDGNWNDKHPAATGAVRFWQHIRLANLAPGSTDLASPNFLPLNSEGGRIGVQSGGAAAPLGLTHGASYIVCSAGIQGKHVRQLDITLDDGDPQTGSLRTGTGTDTLTLVSAANPLEDGGAYTVCMGI
ncbi:prepilin-type N-terminal cleavage/methylation domain-containing protein [Betaproteobacteria bacterium]|nr:prepilin-type N-terminal cleavage/methylation domain-containing protein [Betaproteobacteria bacterium]GHU17463.1 prepilin-type N-terminal cleavage/methylation domain-containing protein [Betaproteobacteria bacterium]